MTGDDRLAVNKKRFTNVQIAAALWKHDGIVPRAAEELATKRQVIHARIDRSPELQAMQAEITDSIRDYARGTIYGGLKAGDAQMARWYAERKMRDEGYGTKVETTVDTAQIERLVDAIAKGGLGALRAVKAALAHTGH
jgi:hypothetical protein